MYMYMKRATLAENQKISWIRSRTGGIKRTRPMRPSTAPNPARPRVCTRKYGCLAMRLTPMKHISASTKKTMAGASENARSTAPCGDNASQKFGIVTCGPWRLGKGRSQPPNQSVTAIDETAIIAAYSARKNNDQRKPLYSVWNPATNSDSASGRSKGARLVSATMATANTKNASSPRGKNLNANQRCCASCDCTMPIMLNVPVVPALKLVIRTAEITANPMAISYDTIWALERSAPISG